MSRVLVVDDEQAICWALQQALTEDGHRVVTVATAEEALKASQSERPDVILMDVRLPGMDGIAALAELRKDPASTPVIIMTAFGSLDIAVGAINSGAFEYLPKPFDLDDAISVIRRALDSAARHPDPLPTAGPEPDDHGPLLGTSPAMQAIFRRIALVAEHEIPVLISGESGTGKELVASVIHQYSRRSSGPFVPVCVPAMNESLVESELFGHARGAFTGAQFERQGLLAAADGGTAFFDEIGDVSPVTQVKLLRVLETRSVTPVGSNSPAATSFRLVAATNRSLEQMVRDGTFREDLYYRLNVFRIELPPLRERGDDAVLLARHFLRRTAGNDRIVFSDDAVRTLQTRPWYGNVRELRNAVEHAVVVTRGRTIGPDAFPEPMCRLAGDSNSTRSLHNSIQDWLAAHELGTSESPGMSLLDRFLAETEPLLLQSALNAADGNRSEAARRLGMHRQTLRERLKRYDMTIDGD